MNCYRIKIIGKEAGYCFGWNTTINAPQNMTNNTNDLNRFKLLGENSLQYSGCVNHGFADTSEA